MNDPRQAAGDSTAPPRRVDGRVVLGTRSGQRPIAQHWVTLHRVGTDHAGPLDSTRTDVAGRFHFRYRPSGDTAAIYFVATSYDGIVYPTSPLRAPVVTGDDATITVFDTTSGPVAIKLGGRHLIIGAPQPNGQRPVGEVYDLVNDSTVTLVARDSTTPVWMTHVPAGATGFQINSNGDLGPDAIAHRGSTVGLFAPLSPGIRQLAFTYDLPANAFPLSVPLARPTQVLEVLVQEPTAKVTGAKLREMAPVSTDGRTFRRFLGQDLAASAIVQIDVPRLVGPGRTRVYEGVAIVVVAAMLLALVVAGRRAAPRRQLAGAPRVTGEPTSQRLLRAIADLDTEFEHAESVTPDARAAYEARRAALKTRLSEALADERRPA